MEESPEVLCARGMQFDSADAVLDTVAKTAVRSKLLKGVTASEIKRLLADREQLISTAVGSRVAIPHCFIEGLESFVVGLVTAPEGVEFSAPDGEPVELFFFIIGPKEKRNQHVKLLSEISRAVREQSTRDALRDAGDEQQLASLVRRFLSIEAAPSEQERCIVHVFIQDEQLFEPILEELSARVEGDVAVQELRSAGSYLHRMPLFAAMWSEQVEQAVKLIVAVVDKRFVNEIARRIHQSAESDGTLRGVLIAVHDLVYSAGGIDF